MKVWTCTFKCSTVFFLINFSNFIWWVHYRKELKVKTPGRVERHVQHISGFLSIILIENTQPPHIMPTTGWKAAWCFMLYTNLMVESCFPPRTDVIFPLDNKSQQAQHFRELTGGNSSNISWLYPAMRKVLLKFYCKMCQIISTVFLLQPF